jgi:hypothetical protein
MPMEGWQESLALPGLYVGESQSSPPGDFFLVADPTVCIGLNYTGKNGEM